MTRLWRMLAAIIAAAMLGVFLTAGAASAFNPKDPFSTEAPCVTNPVILCDPAAAGDSELLPVNRWSDATSSMHSRVDGGILQNITTSIQRNGTFPVLMSLGNSMWAGATGMTSAAISMDVLDAAGEQADNVTATLGSSIMTSGILVLVAVIALMTPMWKAARGQGPAPWMTLLKVAGTLALFAAMVHGASVSDTVGGEFKPGRLSPGWFVVTTNDVIATVASLPATALVAGDDSGAGFSFNADADGELSCHSYVTELKRQYTATNDVTKITGSVPLVMSGLWEATGLEVWATSQFGANNPYGDFSFCRLLEQTSNTPVSTQRTVTMMSVPKPTVSDAGTNLYSLAWKTKDNNQEDRTMIAWGQCRPDGAGGWKLAPGWDKVSAEEGHDPGAQAIKDCTDWWAMPADFVSGKGTTFGDGQSNFNWSGTRSEIVENANNAQTEDYLLTLQGHTGAGASALAMVYAYVFSSLIILVVFGMISLAIILAKISALVMMMAVVFVLLLSLWPNSSASGSVAKFWGQYVGMSLFICGIQLIFALIALITSIMVDAGNEMFGPGTMISMIWTGFSPVVAVALLHMMFTKFLKIPSPFSMSGAQQWGAAASGGAVGGAVGAGLTNKISGQFNGMRGRSERRFADSGARIPGRILGAASGGRFGRGGARRSGALAHQAAATSAGGGPSVAPLSRLGARGAAAPAVAGVAGAVAEPKLSRGDRVKAAAEAKKTADKDALARGAKNTFLGRQAEGAEARIANARGSFTGRPVGKRAQAVAGAKVTGRGLLGAAKVAGAGALIVGTGGMAAPAVAAVWGRKQMGKSRTARDGVIEGAPARAAAAELAKAKAAERIGPRAAQQPSLSPSTIAERNRQLGDVSARRTQGRAAAVVAASATDDFPQPRGGSHRASPADASHGGGSVRMGERVTTSDAAGWTDNAAHSRVVPMAPLVRPVKRLSRMDEPADAAQLRYEAEMKVYNAEVQARVAPQDTPRSQSGRRSASRTGPRDEKQFGK